MQVYMNYEVSLLSQRAHGRACSLRTYAQLCLFLQTSTAVVDQYRSYLGLPATALLAPYCLDHVVSWSLFKNYK